ncbi:MAG: trypsin-like peptidase domain-containing protein [Holosporaceae bacterium]|jgi:serine protease Do|nr:trypsin-like peptidase domain-containing protein [Holosporaceae bacterium]
MRYIFVLFLLLESGLGCIAASGGGIFSIKSGVKAVINAVVEIVVVYKNDGREELYSSDSSRFFPSYSGDDFKNDQQPDGTGFIVDETGYVVTNCHVLGSRQRIHDNSIEKIKVILHNGNEYEAKIVGVDYRTDIVLLKIEPKSKLSCVKFADSDAVEVGDGVFAVGNPYIYKNTVTFGIISHKERDLSGQIVELGSGGDLVPYMQTDAVINQGNSGGPLCSCDGKVVGMITIIFYDGVRNTGISFAIPAKIIQQDIEQLRKNGRMKRSWLGISVTPFNKSVSDALGMGDRCGCVIQRVEEGSPAIAAGIKSGDILLSINDANISENSNMEYMLTNLPIDKVVPIQIMRDGVEMKLSIKVSSRSDEDKIDEANDGAISKKSVPCEEIDSITLGVANLTTELRKYFNIPADVSGVLVARSDDFRNDISVGSVILKVNHTNVQNIEGLRAELQKLMNNGAKIVAFYICDGQWKKFYIPVKLKYSVPNTKNNSTVSQVPAKVPAAR